MWRKLHTLMEAKRGDIFLADLSPIIGSEQGGTRPVLVLSNDVGNKFSPTVIVGIITSQQTKAKLPTHVEINKFQDNLAKNSIVLLEQLRTIDKQRLIRQFATLSPIKMKQIDRALLISLGLY